MVIESLGSGAPAATLIALQMLGILALEIRIRGQVRREHARVRALTKLATALPDGSHIDDCRPGGSRLTIVVSASAGKRSGRG